MADKRRQFFIQRALRKQAAKRGAETRKRNSAKLIEAAWGKAGTTRVPDDELNDTLDDLFSSP